MAQKSYEINRDLPVHARITILKKTADIMQKRVEELARIIATEGPSGSGRYWNVTVGLAEAGKTRPTRGFCVTTSTIGWRTLRNFNNNPLPWVSDRNENGLPEFILWDSFPLREEASMAEFGLIAWVYEADQKGLFRINWQLSREIAFEIASAYRKPLEETNDRIQNMRKDFARYIEEFASQRCTVR